MRTINMFPIDMHIVDEFITCVDATIQACRPADFHGHDRRLKNRFRSKNPKHKGASRMALFGRKQGNIDHLRKLIAEKAALIQKLGADRGKRVGDLASLNDKETTLRAAAYGQDDADALVNLKQLREEKNELMAHIADLDKYAATLNQELAELREQEADLVLKAKRDHVEALLKEYVSTHVERAKRVRAVAQQVRQIMSEASADDLRISDAVRALHPERLAEFADSLRTSTATLVAATCSALMRDVLAAPPSDHLKSAIANPEPWISEHVDQIRDSVNAMPWISDGQGCGLYEATHRVGGLKGHQLNAGDVIRLRESEAAELLAIGALRVHGKLESNEAEEHASIRSELASHGPSEGESGVATFA
jgi:hypothetical protein